MIGCDGGEIMRKKNKKGTTSSLGINFGHTKEKKGGVICLTTLCYVEWEMNEWSVFNTKKKIEEKVMLP